LPHLLIIQNHPIPINENEDKPKKFPHVHRFIVAPSFRKDGRRDWVKAGPKFNSRFQNETICISTRPLLDSARVLKARGYTGHIEMWHEGTDSPCMTLPIDIAAGLTVDEGERVPTFVKWKSFQGPLKIVQATPIALTLKKAAGELTAVQGIDPQSPSRLR
jgi:hypothetical protein